MSNAQSTPLPGAVRVTLATPPRSTRTLGERRSRWMIGGSWLWSACIPLATPHSCRAGGRAAGGLVGASVGRQGQQASQQATRGGASQPAGEPLPEDGLHGHRWLGG